jgi:hypothetical protein
MQESIFEKIKSAVNVADVAERFGGLKLDRNDKALCPFHSEKTPSFSVDRKSNIFHCFGCNAGGDAVDFVAKIRGIEPLEAARQIAESFGIDAGVYGSDKRVGAKPAKRQNKPCDASVGLKTQAGKQVKSKTDIKKYIGECITHAFETDYLLRRGLTAETVKKYHLGYDPKQQRVILPYSSALDYYCARSTALSHDDDFFMLKPKTVEAGQEPLFAKEQLYVRSGAVFVVESQICALSIMQCGYPAVSICGATGGGKLLAAVKMRKPTAVLILALDNDEPGGKAQRELANELFELGAKFLPYNIAGDCKDPNELLVKDANALVQNIKAAIDAATEKFRTKYDSFSAAELQEYRLTAPTWIIDGMLCDGVNFLCAPSKTGKSWMVLQMCLAVSQGLSFLGLDTKAGGCLYLDLEDSHYRLQDRMNKILGGRAAPKNCYFVLEAKRADKGLFEQLRFEMEKHPDIKLIVIDVFQKVRTKAATKESAYSADYNEMDAFKEFVKTHAVSILIVHHLRKMVDEADVFNMISGSVGLMASADNSYIICKKKRDDETARFVMTGRDVYRDPLDVTYDKKTHLWRAVESADIQARNKEKADYENDPVVKTIKGLMQVKSYGWSGTATELSMACVDITGYPLTESADSIGRKIKALEVKLYADGICHKAAASRVKGRRHTFYKKGYAMAQKTLFAEDDGNEE